MDVARHFQACPRCAKIAYFPYLYNDLRYCFDFLQVSKVSCELLINCHILGGRGQAFSGMPKVIQNQKLHISEQCVGLLFSFLHIVTFLLELQSNGKFWCVKLRN